VSIASQPDERSDAIEVYLTRRGDGTLSRALTPRGVPQVGGTMQRVTSAALRGGLTSWVQVGMLVRRMRGRTDPLQGLSQRDTFLALCRLVQAAVEAVPLDVAPAPALVAGAHVRISSTAYPAPEAMDRIERVLGPYAAAGTVTRTGPAVIGWFAIRHLIATRSRDYSLQVVHFTPDDGGDCQLSLMLPREAAQRSSDGRRPLGPRRLRRAAQRAAAEPAAVALVNGTAVNGTGVNGTGVNGTAGAHGNGVNGPAVNGTARAVNGRPGGAFPPAVSGAPVRPLVGAVTAGADPPLQAYLDAYRDHLTRELLLEPVVTSGSAAEFAWTSEPTGDGGVAVGGTVPGAVTDRVVLRMAAHAVAQLGERSPQSGGIPLGDPEPDGDLLVQRWAVGPEASYVLSVAARSGDRRRPTQVLIHFAVAAGRAGGAMPDPTPTPPGSGQPTPAALPYQVPRSGPAVDDAHGLMILPLWWHSADARCDGNDVILYEMPFRGKRLRVRANDYPAEPMYTLLVGDPGAEVAAIDLEDWPTPWVRPRTF
jgi:hypothetical protein